MKYLFSLFIYLISHNAVAQLDFSNEGLVTTIDRGPTHDFTNEPMVITIDRTPKKDPNVGKGEQFGGNGNNENSNTSPKILAKSDFSPNKNQQVVFDLAKNYVANYSQLRVDLYKYQITSTPLLLSAFQKSILSVAGKVMLIWNIAETLSDIKEGKWGSGICFAIGLAPFPYGTAGSILCTNTLTVIRLSTKK